VHAAALFRHMPKEPAATVEVLFRALGDPTRRAVVERLSAGPAAMSVLARGFDMALPSFAQHLGVLERCGLVRSEKRGRVRTYRLAPQALEAGERWLSGQRSRWEHRLDQLDAFLVQGRDVRDDTGRTDGA